MNRSDIEQQYNVKNGRIVSPGKFEGEPVFAPHFWELGLEGFSDDDEVGVFKFQIKQDDPEHEMFPELAGFCGLNGTLRIREDDQGFVHCY